MHVLNKKIHHFLCLVTKFGLNEENVLKSDLEMVMIGCVAKKETIKSNGQQKKRKGENNAECQLSYDSDGCILRRCGRGGHVWN